MIEAYFDGCMEPKNPGGHGAWGAVVVVDGAVVWEKSGYIGCGSRYSNNCSEYAGASAVIDECIKREGVCVVRGDSKLVIMQLSGKWKVRGGLYTPFYLEALSRWNELRHRAKLEWVPREQNDLCDRLSKKVLKDMGIRFRIQPSA